MGVGVGFGDLGLGVRVGDLEFETGNRNAIRLRVHVEF